MNRYVRIITVVLVVLVGGFFVYRSTSNKIEQLRGSQDSLSLELADRWGAGLPDGYTKEGGRPSGNGRHPVCPADLQQIHCRSAGQMGTGGRGNGRGLYGHCPCRRPPRRRSETGWAIS